MTSQMRKFRTAFQFAREKVNWFPGHMANGIRQMRNKMKMVDCIIEVHDARIPFSGRNENLYNSLTVTKPHMLVLNKKDLANLRHLTRIKDLLREKMKDEHVLFTECNNENCSGVKQIVPMALDLIKSSPRPEKVRVTRPNLSVMIIGVPNVGKSSMINVLRNLHIHKAKCTKVGASPGITRSVMEKIKICEDPPLYLLDTPGVLQANIKNAHVGMKLAVCGTICNDVIDVFTRADFLLYWFNKHEYFSYVKYFGLEGPTDDIYKVLILIAQNHNRVVHIRDFNGDMVTRPDLTAASHYFLKAFQLGNLGKFMLDVDLVRTTKDGPIDEEFD